MISVQKYQQKKQPHSLYYWLPSHSVTENPGSFLAEVLRAEHCATFKPLGLFSTIISTESHSL